MAAEISCPRALAEVHSEVVVVKFPKSLRTRCGQFWTLCSQLLLRACDGFLTGIRGLLMRRIASAWASILVVVIVALVMGLFWSGAFVWVPLVITESCHKGPGIALTNFTTHDMAVASTPDSPWQVNSAFDATFWTWNRNTNTKCFTTYRRMDVRVEYKGHIILQQQFPLGFSLKPRARRPFSIEMKSDQGQLTKDLGAYLQAQQLRSDNITLNFFFDTRYLIADRRSKWESIGCVVIVPSRLGTMLKHDCFPF